MYIGEKYMTNSLNEDEKHEFQTSEFHDEIAAYFDYTADFTFLDVVATIIDSIDFDEVTEENADEIADEEIDNDLIYTVDQWTIIEHYCDPQSASYDSALEEFEGDICGLVEQIAKEKGANPSMSESVSKKF